jgi:hypothetical protein
MDGDDAATRRRYEAALGGLRLLTWVFALSAASYALSFTLALLAMLRGRSAWDTSSSFSAVPTLWAAVRAGLSAAAVLTAVGAARLRLLPPPVRREERGPVYRAATQRVQSARLGALARLAFFAAVAGIVFDLAGMVSQAALPSAGLGLLLTQLHWALERGADTAALVLFAVWALGLGRELALRLPAPLAAAVIALSLGRLGLLLHRLAVGKTGDGMWMAQSATGVAMGACAALLAHRASVALDAHARQPDEDAAPAPAEAPPDWRALASGLSLFSTGLTVRIVAAVLITPAFVFKTPGGSFVPLVPGSVALGLGVVMMVALRRWMRLPESSPARLPAMIAFGLYLAALLADAQVLASHFRFESEPMGETTANGLAGAVLWLAFVFAFAESMRRVVAESHDLAAEESARRLTRLTGGLFLALLGVALLGLLHPGMLAFGAIPAVGLLIVLFRLFAVLREVRAALAAR